jgi:hypothetical protein
MGGSQTTSGLSSCWWDCLLPTVEDEVDDACDRSEAKDDWLPLSASSSTTASADDLRHFLFAILLHAMLFLFRIGMISGRANNQLKHKTKKLAASNIGISRLMMDCWRGGWGAKIQKSCQYAPGGLVTSLFGARMGIKESLLGVYYWRLPLLSRDRQDQFDKYTVQCTTTRRVVWCASYWKRTFPCRVLECPIQGLQAEPIRRYE